MSGLLSGSAAGPADPRRFTILHTNDLHSALRGVGPSSEYTPATTHDDLTVGGYARLACLIGDRRSTRGDEPVLVLDAGDYSMGSAFGAVDPETGGSLRLMALMGFDATTLGNHDLDLGPDGLARSIVAARAQGTGRAPVAVVASNLEVPAGTRTDGLRAAIDDGSIVRSLVLERGGLRFGIVGVMGAQAARGALDPAGVVVTDPVEALEPIVDELRRVHAVDVVVCLSHCGLLADAEGRMVVGPDVDIATALPGIDVVVGGHSHTAVVPPIVTPDGRPVVQAGKYGEVLGELQVTLHDDGTRAATGVLHPVDDSILGDPVVEAEVERLARRADALIFEPDGLRMDQPLAIATEGLSNSFTDLVASVALANLVTDAFRSATGADVAMTVNGLIRAGVRAGAHGIQTVYDVFALTPIGEGVDDETTLGTHLVVVPLSVAGLVDLIELLLADTPRRPGRHVPRTSGFRYGFDPDARPGARVTWCELGDATTGPRAVDLDDPTALSLAMPANLHAIASRADAPLARALEELVSIASRPDPPVREWEAVVAWLRARPRPKGSLLVEIPEPGAPVDQRVVAQATSSQP